MTNDKIRLIEYILALKFGFRQNIIVTNISWGFPQIGHECDLLIMSPDGYLKEIEIKTSISDLKADAKKRFKHGGIYIRQYYYALTKEIYEKAIEFIPSDSGIISVDIEDLSSRIMKKPKTNNSSLRLTKEEMYSIARLGTMRAWSGRRLYLKSNGFL